MNVKERYESAKEMYAAVGGKYGQSRGNPGENCNFHALLAGGMT